MGIHVCAYVHVGEVWYPDTSSGDVVLKFSSGRAWEMPDMILHYIRDHNFLPPAEFIDDVMNHVYVGGERYQTKSLDTSRPVMVGYLTGAFEIGNVPSYFVEKLESLMSKSERDGMRRQTRSG